MTTPSRAERIMALDRTLAAIPYACGGALALAYDAFHDPAAAGCRVVPFADTTIPILGPEHLIVCESVFNRPRNWVDIDAIVAADMAIDVPECSAWSAASPAMRTPSLCGSSRCCAVVEA